MKRILLFPLLFFAGMTLFACNPSDDAPSAPETNTPEQSGNAGDSETNEHPENDENEDTPMENNTLKLTVNGRSFTATLVKNSSTEALMKQLAQGSVDIRMDDYGDMEKVGSLGFSLPRNDRQTSLLFITIRIHGTLLAWERWMACPAAMRCWICWVEKEKLP